MTSPPADHIEHERSSMNKTKCDRCPKSHRLHIRRGDTEVIVVRGGPQRAYLWVERRGSNGHLPTAAWISGAATLRKIAKAILAEVGNVPSR